MQYYQDEIFELERMLELWERMQWAQGADGVADVLRGLGYDKSAGRLDELSTRMEQRCDRARERLAELYRQDPAAAQQDAYCAHRY